MKITKQQLKQIIKEEMSNLDEAMDFNERKVQVTRIHDGFVDFLEAEEKFPMGEIPRSVLDAIMKTALTVVDAMDADGVKSDKEYKTTVGTKSKKMDLPSMSYKEKIAIMSDR